jgi:putative ABC transport system permease protein
MLGIIIGVAAVIGIVTVGESMRTAVTGEMHDMGATNIGVFVRAYNANFITDITGTSPIPTGRDLITNAMIDEFYGIYRPYVSAIALSNFVGMGRVGDLAVNVTGVNPGYAITHNLDIVGGRFIRDEDMASHAFVAVISRDFAEISFPEGNALGREISVSVGGRPLNFEIVGIYEHAALVPPIFGGGTGQVDIYIPLATSTMFIGGIVGHQNLTVTAIPGLNFEEFATRVRQFFDAFYENNPIFRIGTSTMDTLLNLTNEIMGILSVAVAVIAAISLVVAGVGVMNIMLVSVTERTREIGMRKALGARNSSIRAQFLVEAMLICGIGGILGIAVGIALGYFGGLLLGFPGWPNIATILVAVLFSMMIGLFFGYYPANKAAKLDPIEALRYE